MSFIRSSSIRAITPDPESTQRLKPNLHCDDHYTVLPDKAYQLLKRWHGIREAQSPGLRRFVAGPGELTVEVSAPVFNLAIATDDSPDGDVTSSTEVVLGKAQPLTSLAQVRERLLFCFGVIVLIYGFMLFMMLLLKFIELN